MNKPPASRHQESREHFKHRLEAFSDIVFALALSQLALQLEVPKRIEDLTVNPVAYLLFFVTFAIVCFYWIAHYRMFRLAFQAYPVDIFLNFVFLAFTAILPYTLQVYIKFASHWQNGNKLPYGLYIASFAGTALPMSLLFYRALLRRDPSLTPKERLDVYRAFLRNAFILATTAICGIVLALATYPFLAMYPFAILGPAIAILRRRVKRVPARFLPEGMATA
ncbi:MAG: DUF1211 domain-containing protein [Candidatus Eremiobacteraeota bacterium]|nr:DUF1211 domain-containing protein [Candidatus Eremiobacteraeota bacterium]